jgi:hypothetical protein
VAREQFGAVQQRRAWDRAAAPASRAARGARAEDRRVQGLICLPIFFTYMHVFDVFLKFVKFTLICF